MVRKKNLNAAAGRKLGIEGIVKNLSAKALGTPSIPDENHAEPISVLGVRERMDTQNTCSITSRGDPVETVFYNLPVGMDFFGIIASKHLLKGQKFGPFLGNITQIVEPSALNHFFISQMSDVEGNDYCLNLNKTSIDSSKWLNCLQRCTSHGEYNIVIYNTPTGIFLQTVCDVLHGQPLCVAYDRAYDLPQAIQISVQSIQSPKTFSPPLDGVAEPFVNLRATVGPEFLARINEQLTSVCALEITNPIDNHVSTNGNDTEMREDLKPTYNVMTADVSQTYYPPNDVSKNSLNGEFTQIGAADEKFNKAGGKVKKPFVGKIYKCTSCRSCFNSLQERHDHMDTAHTAECSICKKTYTSSYLKEHMTFHYESSRVTCRVCSKVFSSISNLRKHEKKHGKRGFPFREKKRLFKCSECPETFHSQKYLEVHRKKHVRVVPITCNDCGEVFAQKNLLRRHQAVVHKGIRPFSCRYCHKTFTQRGNLARHCRQAHSEKNAKDLRLMKDRFLCRRRGCNGSFSSRELYIQHLQEHSGNTRIYSCEDCTCVFSSAGNLSKHRKALHGGSSSSSTSSMVKPPVTQSLAPPVAAAKAAADVEAKYHCSQCQRPFQNHFQLNRHMRVHKDKKKEIILKEEIIKCDGCGKIFMTKSGLSKHVKYLRCAVKGKASVPKDSNAPRSSILPESKSSKAEVKSELVKSTREVRATRAARDSKVSKEIKLESPFGCTTCGKDFTSAWYLKIHRRTHTSYHVPCELCGKMFSHVTNLAKHMKYIHQRQIQRATTAVRKPREKPKPKVEVDVEVKSELSCGQCNKSMANINSLAVHKQLHYGVKPFKCEFCETRFTQKCNMKRHLGTCKNAIEHQNSTKTAITSRTRSDPGPSSGAGEYSGRAGNATMCEQPSSPVF